MARPIARTGVNRHQRLCHCRHRIRTTRSEAEELPAAAGLVESSPNSSAASAQATAPLPDAVPVVERLELEEGVRVAPAVEEPWATAGDTVPAGPADARPTALGCADAVTDALEVGASTTSTQ